MVKNYLKHGFIGFTFNKILAFLFVYYAILIAAENISGPWSDKESNFCSSVKNWNSDHKNMVKVLAFLLGFYTATVMKRWWSQISNMAIITNVTNILNGTVQPGEKGIQLKKTILRYCLLSWTLLMHKISPIMKKEYPYLSEQLFDKGLITKVEVEKLTKKHQTSDELWWIPINWCMQLVNTELNENGLLPK
jgi:hypothetical protein